MEDKKTELQKRFEEQTPTIKDVSQIEYLQTFISWLHLQVERLQGKKLPIHSVSNQRELLIAFYHHVQENDIDHNIPQRIERMVDNYLKRNL